MTLKNENQRKIFTREHGVKGKYQLMKLPNHRGAEQIVPDGMHTIKDVVVHIIELMIGAKNLQKIEACEDNCRYITVENGGIISFYIPYWTKQCRTKVTKLLAGDKNYVQKKISKANLFYCFKPLQIL